MDNRDPDPSKTETDPEPKQVKTESEPTENKLGLEKEETEPTENKQETEPTEEKQNVQNKPPIPSEDNSDPEEIPEYEPLDEEESEPSELAESVGSNYPVEEAEVVQRPEVQEVDILDMSIEEMDPYGFLEHLETYVYPDTGVSDEEGLKKMLKDFYETAVQYANEKAEKKSKEIQTKSEDTNAEIITAYTSQVRQFEENLSYRNILITEDVWIDAFLDAIPDDDGWAPVKSAIKAIPDMTFSECMAEVEKGPRIDKKKEGGILQTANQNSLRIQTMKTTHNLTKRNERRKTTRKTIKYFRFFFFSVIVFFSILVCFALSAVNLS